MTSVPRLLVTRVVLALGGHVELTWQFHEPLLHHGAAPRAPTCNGPTGVGATSGFESLGIPTQEARCGGELASLRQRTREPIHR